MSSKCGDVVVMEQKSVAGPPPIDLGINVEKPKFPQYAVYSKRLESFDSWPDYLPVSKEELVEAGLVYTGVGDSCRCYFCGGGLRNWEYDDVPMEEHAKWYPKCPHVLLVKGQNYVEKLIRGERPEEDGANESDAVVVPPSHIESVAAQSCLEMGYSKEMVQKAIDAYIQRYDETDFKGSDLCELLFDMEENPEEFQNNEVSDSRIPSIEEDGPVESEDEVNEDGLSSQDLQRLAEENQRLKENQTCKICLDKIADVLFLPCGHMIHLTIVEFEDVFGMTREEFSHMPEWKRNDLKRKKDLY